MSVVKSSCATNISYNLSRKTVHQIARGRTEQVRRWTILAANLANEERKLQASLSPPIAGVLKDKRLCPLSLVIRESGHEDLTLVDDLKRGFDLTGAFPRFRVFSQKFRQASMSCDDLRRVSDLGRTVLLDSVQSSGEKELDVSLFEATLKEVEEGFIQGTIDKSELPAGSTLTKRFPVRQKNKVCPIDDYNASLVNFAVTQSEGATIHTIDHIAAAAMVAC